MIGWFVAKLLAKPRDATDPRLDIVHADLKGLSPVTIINAQIDPLRENGPMLEAASKKAGVNVDRKVYSGVNHEFFGMGAAVAPRRRTRKNGRQGAAQSGSRRFMHLAFTR